MLTGYVIYKIWIPIPACILVQSCQCLHCFPTHYRKVVFQKAYMSWHTKKGPYVFLVCGSSNAHAQSPIGATDIHSLPEASSRILLYVCEQQRLKAKLCLCAGLPKLLLVAYLVRTIFSCAGSYMVDGVPDLTFFFIWFGVLWTSQH